MTLRLRARLGSLAVCVLLTSGCASTQASDAPTSSVRINDDEFTRYELLEPDSHAFRITHEVTVTQVDARACFLYMRGGVLVSEVTAEDPFTGERLGIGLVDGEAARANGHLDAVRGERYLAIPLARPVPAGGETRVVVRLRYEDPDCYTFQGDRIRFERVLGVKRVAIVLPAQHEILAANHPVQVRELADGRIEASLINASHDALTLKLEARRLPEDAAAPISTPQSARGQAAVTAAPRPAGGSPAISLERAHEDREIVYFLQAPETHSFRLYHDYTETRPGADKYLNVVRAGSRVSEPSAWLLDSGAALAVETLTGADVLAAGWESPDEIRPESEVVVVRYPPVEAGRSVRLRIEETYTDPDRYGLQDSELAWDRSFGRTRNALVLPEGWYLTANAIPATISETEDGRIRLDYWNARPDSIAVHLRARNRQPPEAP